MLHCPAGQGQAMSKFTKHYCHEVRENNLSGGGETGYYRKPHKGNCVFVIWLRQDESGEQPLPGPPQCALFTVLSARLMRITELLLGFDLQIQRTARHGQQSDN